MSVEVDRSQLPAGHNSINQFVIVKGSALEFLGFVITVFEAKEHEAVRTPDRDGSLIHAEVEIGGATLMVADSKADWPLTPALIQVYVSDAQAVLDRAEENGATVVTRLSPFYGVRLARFLDPWQNLWWLFEPDLEGTGSLPAGTDWHRADPSYVYTTLMDTMRGLGTRTSSAS
jgi:PhnB protein